MRAFPSRSRIASATLFVFVGLGALSAACTEDAPGFRRRRGNSNEEGALQGVDTPCESTNIPKARLWRLSTQQYANTVKAVFDVDVDVAAMPLDGVADDGLTHFDTNSDVTIVTDRLATIYREQATVIASAVLGKIEGSSHACVATPSASDACVRDFVTELGSAAYRRPLDEAEVDRLATFYAESKKAHDANAATRMVIEALAQSPHFLYRSELGDEDGSGRVRLTPFELASELAYFVTDAPPDRELFEAASKNELDTAERVRAQAERLVQTPAFRAKLRSFFRQYLLLKDLSEGGKPKDEKQFPGFDGARSALVEETLTFVDKAIFEDKLSLEGLFNADYSYHDATVATYYGTKVSGERAKKVPLSNGRKGIVSHAAVLAALSNEGATSPVHRGTFFLQTLLCRKLPEAPADVSAMVDRLRDPNNPEATQRELWTYFQKAAPECAGCHTLFHPLGLGLEKFDAVGKFRDIEFGKPIDTSVAVTGVGGDVDGTYADGFALAEKVVSTPEGHACFAQQYTTYSFGRHVGKEEECRIKSFARAFSSKPLSIPELVVAMTTEDGFFFRNR